MTVEDMKNAIITFVNIAEEECMSKEFEELDRNGVEILKALDELEQYRAIGTVSDYRELNEKATAKKQKEDEERYCSCGGYISRFHNNRCLRCGAIHAI